MKRLRSLLFSLLIASFFIFPTCAMEVNSASNRFVFDRTAFFQENITGDLIALGNDVSIKGSALGDVIAAGSTVFVQMADTTSNIYCAGGTVAISADTARNIYTAGSYVKINKGTDINGAYIVGKDIYFSGAAKDLYVAGENVNIDGSVSGNLVIRGNNINISNAAKIIGNIEIYSSKEPVIPATINKANVKFNKIMPRDNEQRNNQMGMGMLILKLLGILTAVLISIIFTALNSKYFKDKAEELKIKLGRYILYGLIAFIVVPIASIIVMFFVITIPISIIVLLIYGITLFVAPVYTGVVLGRLFLKKINRYLAAMAGAAAVGIVLMVPFVCMLVYLFCAFYTLGSIVNNIKLGKKEPQEAKEQTVKEEKIDIADEKEIISIEEKKDEPSEE